MNRVVQLVLVLIVIASASAWAQVVTTSTGAINGTVTDNTKGVLPGVSVSIQSPQMMGTREATTDDQGRYQFAAVPPGEYRVAISLPGFRTVINEGIRVTLGFTATVNAELQVAAQEETVTVTGQSPVVDTTATNVTNNFDAETIQNLPTARDFPALMAETPGVAMTRIDVGGSAALTEVGFRVYGMSGGGDQLSTEGITAPNLSNLYNDFGAFQEVQITTAAHTAEMAAPGVMSNIIFKSGGNEYAASFYMDYEKDEWGSRNIDDRQLALGVTGGFDLDARDTNRVDEYKDINGDLGGYLKKDTLWWYGSLRYNASDVRYVNFPVKAQHTSISSQGVKLTYNLNQNNKLIGFYNRNAKHQPERFINRNQIHYSLDEPWDQDFPLGQFKGEYNSVLSKSLFLELRAGLYFKDFWNYSRAPQKPLYVDSVTQERFGGERANFNYDRKPQTNGSLSYFNNNWGVAHNVKFGWEVAYHGRLDQEFGRFTRASYGNDSNPPPDVEHRLLSGVPAEVVLRESPAEARVYQWTTSVYVNDAWQLNDRLSFNLGLRFDRYRNGMPEQVHPVGYFNATEDRFAANPDVFHFNVFGPRLGLVWDPRGTGKTVIKANYAAYPWRPFLNATPWNPNPREWIRRYVWSDLNGDRVWQPGEEGRILEQTGGITNQPVDPNWKDDVTSEVVTWVERELAQNFAMRTGFVWRGNKFPQVSLNPNRPISAYNVPITVNDPGPDGVLATGDDGSPFTAYNLDPAYLNVPLVNMTTHNPYVDGDDHYTWEISGTKRMSNSWSLNTSFAHTWSRATPNGTNPAAFIGTEDDQRKHYTDWQAKLAATLLLPHDLKATPLVRHQSGDPFGRTIQVRMNYGTQTIQVEPESARRVDNPTILDVRLEKGLSIRRSRAALFLDVFNILNANPDQEIVQGSGATFLRPLVIVSPRVARLGVKFEW